MAIKMFIALPFLLPFRVDLIIYHSLDDVHPLYPKLCMMTMLFSGKHADIGGIHQDTINIIMPSERSGTRKQYVSYICRWIQYNSERDISVIPLQVRFWSFVPQISEVWNSIHNTARSAVLSFIQNS